MNVFIDYPSPRMPYQHRFLKRFPLTSSTLMQWAGNNAANLTVGYSPVLTFEIRSMDETICEALQQGAFLDGSMKYMAVGKVYPYILCFVSTH